ncbi:response regulator [bacterium]|nr:response regulator [bacterium]
MSDPDPSIESLQAELAELQRENAQLRAAQAEFSRARFAEKMEALARLSGGIAHDFNNVLILVFGYCEFLLERLHKDGPLYHYLCEIRDAGEHAALLTRLLMMFGARRVFQPVVMNINGIIKAAEPRLRTIVGNAGNIELRLSGERTLAKIEPVEIEQALTNIVGNARDALDGSGAGRVIISTDTVLLDERTAAGLGIAPGMYVRLRVEDNGGGMDGNVEAHALEPFFSTKQSAKHPGLGLFTVYAIVRQCNGAIACESTKGQGTEISIYLPRVDGVVQPAAAKPREITSLAGSETILVVEDDTHVRLLLREVLRTKGYQVLEAEDGNAALTLLGQYTGPVHLLLTDVVMPEMNGRELAEAALERFPSLKIIYMSGYTDDEVLRDAVLSFRAMFLQKPFRPQVLLEKVREVLATPSTPSA